MQLDKWIRMIKPWRFRGTLAPIVHGLRRYRRRLLTGGVLALVGLAIFVVGARGYSALQAQGRIYVLDEVPARPVAIIFGAEVYHSGRLSAMLLDRVKAGVHLYQDGKASVLLMTGDNHISTYNEPEAMRQEALRLGVPDSAIVLDYAGFRTYDSCYRARDIFKLDQAILVTQAFHLDRALLICNALGIDSVGVAADTMRPEGYTSGSMLYSQLREFPSTVVSIFDLVRGGKPTFLGKPLPILKQSPAGSAGLPS